MAGWLWLYINGADYKEQTVSLPITFQNLPAEMVLLDGSQVIVTLKIRARNYQFNQINFPEVIHPVVDLQRAAPGEWSYPVRIDISNMNPQPSVTLGNPEVRGMLDRIEIRTLPVRARIDREPPSGFQVDSVRVIPERATLRGPSGVLRSMQYVETLSIDVSQSSNTFETAIGLNLPPSVSEVDPQPLSARVVIVRKTTAQDVRLTVSFTNLTLTLTPASPRVISVRLDTGGTLPTNYQNLVRAAVDCSGIFEPGRYERSLTYVLPDGWRIVSAPDKIPFELSPAN
jgi:hypothetical protein